MTGPLVAVIDDDEALCSSLVDLMRSTGYRAESFASAEAFLAGAQRFAFDCVIVDVQLPGMKGPTLIRKLHDEGGMTPVVLITALPDRYLDDEAISVGAQCLLRKPFETQVLFDYVEKSLFNERPV